MLPALSPQSTLRGLAYACQQRPARWIALMAVMTLLGFAYSQSGNSPGGPATLKSAAIGDSINLPACQSHDGRSSDTLVKLNQAVDAASRQLETCRAELALVESLAGEDLEVLHARNNSSGTDGNLQLALADVEQALQRAEEERQSNRKLADLLEAARAEPDRLTPALTQSPGTQPALRQVSEALTGARFTTTQLQETMLPAHPKVQASRAVEEEIAARLQRELTTAWHAVRAEQPRLDAHVAALAHGASQLQERQRRLFAIRSEYDRQLAQIQQHTDMLMRARNDLAAAEDAWLATDRLAQSERVDDPSMTVNERIESPAASAHELRTVRPVRTWIVVAGLLGVGLLGGGLVGIGILLRRSRWNALPVSRPVETPVLLPEPTGVAFTAPSPPLATACELARSSRPTGGAAQPRRTGQVARTGRVGRTTLSDALVRLQQPEEIAH
ncbi:MAG: hypothetical protein ACYC4U_03650 [Pirellulaceae bacterium]